MPAPGYRNLSIAADALDALNALAVSVSAAIGIRVSQSDAIRIIQHDLELRHATISTTSAEIRDAARDLGIRAR